MMVQQVLVVSISIVFLTLLWIFFAPRKVRSSSLEKGGEVHTKLIITGMHCTGCALNIENTLKDLKGTKNIGVNFSTGLADVAYDPSKVAIGDIVKSVSGIGYGARLATDQASALKQARLAKESDVRKIRNNLLIGLPFAIYVTVGTMLMMFYHFPMWFVWTLVAAAVPVMFWTGWHFFISAWKIALHRQTDMNTLVALGVLASFVYSIVAILYPGIGEHQLYLDGSVVIVMLVLLGNYLRGRAELSAMKEIFDVASLLPEKAHRIKDGIVEDVPISELAAGDIVQIKATERAPADCTIVKGSSEFNNAHITGESMPVPVSVGDSVYAGAINGFGLVEAKCDKVGESTVLSRVIELIGAAIQTKPKIQGLVDRIASIFVPTSITISVTAFVVWFLLGHTNVGLNSAISVLVISCPCALGLATPTSISIALGISAKSGMLIKNARSLEALEEVKTFVFDKTGTLTAGRPEVTSIHPESVSEGELIKLTAMAESGSEHTLAQAIKNLAISRNIPIESPQNFEAVPGLGVKATFAGGELVVGGPRMVEKLELKIPLVLLGTFRPEEAAFYVSLNNKIIGGFGLSDPLRPEALQAMKELIELGIEPVLVSGDRKEVCESVASQLGIKRVYSQTLPEEKVQIVEALRGDGFVAMMGDGVNDAAALAMADASFAPRQGTGMALDTADVTVMNENLLLVPQTVRLARATKKNIQWNLFWAFIYNTLAIPVAAGVLYPVGIQLNPMIASAAMAASSITVVMNALRLKLFKITTAK
ncbi:MAG: cation-translocating P-type ATPase [Caldisericia bacterium]|nr:cation-translocating P-type ATPase [Caldisericia bacterium]